MLIGIATKSHHRDSRRQSTFVHNLDDDSLLNVFHYCRPAFSNEGEFPGFYTFQQWKWEDGRWWYNLVQVCRRWRYLVIGSAFHLGISFLCTYGTPVADMLAHEPSLPLSIDRLHHHDTTPKDNEDILLAIQCRDRVHRIRLQIPVPDLETLVKAMDGEFPMLEYLAITPPTLHYTDLMLPSTFHAPRLRHLMLLDTTFPIASPSLSASAGLVTLSLRWVNPSTFLFADELLQGLSFVPRLEILQISFGFSVFDPNVEKQMSHEPIMTHVSLPNLRRFAFEGDRAYFEALLPWLTMVLLEKLKIVFFREPTFHVPHLLQLLTLAESCSFGLVDLTFYEEFVSVMAHPSGAVGLNFSVLYLDDRSFHRQLNSAVRIFNSLGTLFSAVENLTLGHERNTGSEDQDTDADRTRWCKLLRTFPNVTSLCIEDRRTGELSRSLQFGLGESPMDLLPQLRKLLSHDDVGIFSAFADARQKAGRPVSLVAL